ncbi:DMT family transporter [Deefgea salmonis]|uniref:DMT family transporter n=1 Tax=Deefgea salmonis TaxID=2875502 RepID=A0ABS8BMP6_9NEIS|nr:DMT family transporter [Deefgea salmonis]MCB5197003.1 DMT family transporter [Deefgea salmonis]
MPNSAQSIRIGVFLAAFAATGFAMKGVFIKLAYPYGVDAVTLVMLRLMFAIALLWMVRLWRLHASSDAPETPIAPLDKFKLFGLGLLGYYLSSVLDFIGLETVSASLERLILCLYPTFTVLLVSWFSGQPIPPKIKRALPLTYLGMVLVLAPELMNAHADWVGIGFVVASTLAFSLYMAWSPAVIERVGSMRFTELALTVSGLGILVHWLISHPLSSVVQPWPVWAYALTIAIFSTVLPVYAMTNAMKRIGAGRTAVIGSFGPVLSIVLSMGILNERLSALQWLGAAIVLSGVWMVSKK